MARATITYVFNPATGKREWHIDYESAPDATIPEHEKGHREVVRNLVGKRALEEGEVETDRGGGSKEKMPEEEPLIPKPKGKLQ
jgi:hypothetical protein